MRPNVPVQASLAIPAVDRQSSLHGKARRHDWLSNPYLQLYSYSRHYAADVASLLCRQALVCVFRDVSLREHFVFLLCNIDFAQRERGYVHERFALLVSMSSARVTCSTCEHQGVADLAKVGEFDTVTVVRCTSTGHACDGGATRDSTVYLDLKLELSVDDFGCLQNMPRTS